MSAAAERTGPSSLAPFHSMAFSVLWIATVVSNVGTWMSIAASGWLMASLDSSPLVVALVQVASSLPMFLFALLGGVLSDIVDRRRFIIVINITLMLLAAALAATVWLDAMTAGRLLVFTFLASTGGALLAPAWQAVVPQLVPSHNLASAVAANSVGVNVSRAGGPALAGGLIALCGIAAPFWSNVGTYLIVIGALLWWQPPAKPSNALPPERLAGAVRIGIRHAKSNPHLQATLIRAVGFFVFASAYWALLPLLARDRIAAGPAFYGALLGAIGAGAIGGALALPWLRSHTGRNGLVATGTLGTAVALALFGLAREPGIALLASVTAGASWIAVVSSLNVATQTALPDWVRGRGLALFVTAFYGAMTFGSVAWGAIAGHIGLPLTLYLAAAGAFVALTVTSRWRLLEGPIDAAPSMHWPAPIEAYSIDGDRGPVLITVEYETDPSERDDFLSAIASLAQQRTSSGAYHWGVFEDAAQPGRFVESFYLDSWLEHLRQHERVTNADRPLQDSVRHFDKTGAPKVSHLIAVRTVPPNIPSAQSEAPR
jgi:MFS family permease